MGVRVCVRVCVCACLHCFQQLFSQCLLYLSIPRAVLYAELLGFAHVAVELDDLVKDIDFVEFFSGDGNLSNVFRAAQLAVISVLHLCV